MTDHWQPGEVVVLRYLRRVDGLPGSAWPLRIIEDSEDLVALFLARGTKYVITRRVKGEYYQANDVWRRDTLRLMFPERPYSVWFFWEHDGASRSFGAYYLNMEEPFRRSSIGFDTNDHALDIVVGPDFAWRMKDEEDFESLVLSGGYSEEFAAQVRADAQGAIDLIETRGSPFCDGWEDWEPDASWPVPELPPDWAEVSPVPWERASWAYLNRA